jgi:hypothetical protein
VTNPHSTFMENVLISVGIFYIHCNLSDAFTLVSKEQKVSNTKLTKVMENEMCRACSTNGGEEECI